MRDLVARVAEVVGAIALYRLSLQAQWRELVSGSPH